MSATHQTSEPVNSRAVERGAGLPLHSIQQPGSPSFEPFDVGMARQRMEAAEQRAEEAQLQRDAAIEELANVKRHIGWMMEKTLIRDIIMQGDPGPAGQPPYEMLPDTEDTARLAWLNEHGRVSMGDQCFVVAFNHGGGDIGNTTFPTPYNIRHLLDLCRQNPLP